MARTVPFPISRIPASIKHPIMKLFCVCVCPQHIPNNKDEEKTFIYCVCECQVLLPDAKFSATDRDLLAVV